MGKFRDRQKRSFGHLRISIMFKTTKPKDLLYIEDKLELLYKAWKERLISREHVQEDVHTLIKKGIVRYSGCSQCVVDMILSLPLSTKDAKQLLEKLEFDSTYYIYEWLRSVKHNPIKAHVLLHFCDSQVKDNGWHTYQIRCHNLKYRHTF